MKILLIDFHDSYTYNVRDLIYRALGVLPQVVLFDDPLLTADFIADFAAIVLSPGPGDPRLGSDVGQIPELISGQSAPVLGICFGHQILALLAGARVKHVVPQHGSIERLIHYGGGLCADAEGDIEIVRYHSLAVMEPLPDSLVADAWTPDGTLMAFHSLEKPWWAVQFHPESVCSDGGVNMIRAWGKAAGFDVVPATVTVSELVADKTSRSDLVWREIPEPTDLAAVHEALCADKPQHFWLDSSLIDAGRSRWSFIGFPHDGQAIFDDFTQLRQRMVINRHDETFPVPLQGGWVGYRGYDSYRVDLAPRSLWLRAARYLAVDHIAHRAWLVAETGDDPTSAHTWLVSAAEKVLAVIPPSDDLPESLMKAVASTPEYVADSASEYQNKVRRAQEFLVAGDSYEVCLTTQAQVPLVATPKQLRAMYRRQRIANPAPYAAFIATPEVTVLCSSPERFLWVNHEGVSETKPIKGTARRDDDPIVDATLAQQLMDEAKTRAELLMVVDLLRNDMSRVCEPGSVAVPDGMVVESYQSVHQLLARITGQLPASASAVDLAMAMFPGGSMTGAPKERTMQIIDELEQRPRGVYSGVLGYFSDDGAADLNIVIRSSIYTEGVLSTSAGGAVVLASVAEAEFEEMLLKLNAPIAWAITS
ncbi:MAG: chorismate-binding protein [Propionibacteriaceae bacterium]